MRPVVQNRDLGREHHHEFGKPEVVDAVVRQCLQASYDVIAEVADHSGVERRQSLGGRGGEFDEGLLQDTERVTVTDAGQFPTQPDALTRPAQGGVQADRGEVICQQTGMDSDHTSGPRQLGELGEGRRDVQHSASLPVNSVKKQVGLPVWQATPVCSTRSSTVSPSQSR